MDFKVTNKEDAVDAVAKLLEWYTSDTAYDRLSLVAKSNKQAVSEEARRAASKLLRSYRFDR